VVVPLAAVTDTNPPAEAIFGVVAILLGIAHWFTYDRCGRIYRRIPGHIGRLGSTIWLVGFGALMFGFGTAALLR